MGDLIPKRVNISEVNLTPKGLLKLTIGFVVIMAVFEVAKWIYDKAKEKTVENTGSGGLEVI